MCYLSLFFGVGEWAPELGLYPPRKGSQDCMSPGVANVCSNSQCCSNVHDKSMPPWLVVGFQMTSY